MAYTLAACGGQHADTLRCASSSHTGGSHLAALYLLLVAASS